MPQQPFRAPRHNHPGSISDLVLNGNIAFRARFDGAPPRTPASTGAVRSWTISTAAPGASASQIHRPQVEVRSPRRLRNHPRSPPATLAALPRRPVAPCPMAHCSRRACRPCTRTGAAARRFRFSSAPDFRFGLDESRQMLNAALRLPRQGNEQARALADGWRRKHTTPDAIAAEALQLFRREAFIYTFAAAVARRRFDRSVPLRDAARPANTTPPPSSS